MPHLIEARKLYQSDPSGLRLPRWLPVVALVTVVCVTGQLLSLELQNGLRYDRLPVDGFQLWRLLSANFIHLGWSHLALNILGLVLVSWIFARDWPPLRWLLALLFSGVVSTSGIHLASPEVFWLVGLSGALHGLFAFGAVGWIRQQERMGWVLLAGLVAKLIYENLTGSLSITQPLVGGAIVTDAHVWGALGGLLAAALDRLCWRQGPAPL